jgi:tetratricopeptide (TPR) repeat protein
LHGEYDAAERAYRAALLQRRASGCLAPGEETDVLLRLARVLLHAGCYAEAQQVCERARRFAPVRELQAISLAMLALTHCYTGCLDRVDDSIAEARDLLRRRNGENLPRRLRAEALIGRAAGNLASARSNFGAAAAAYRRAARICSALDDRWEHSIALYNLADAALGQGKTADAFRLLDRAGSEKRAIGDTWGLAYVHHARARAHLVRVQARPALDEASTGLELALRVADPKLVALLNVTLGRAHQANGDLVGAQRSLELAVDSARNASPIELTEARHALAELESATRRNSA